MDASAFHVPFGRHLMSGIVQHARPFWRWLGNVESRFVREQIEQTPNLKPIYVCGLARAGTSVAIEILASHPDIATHQYRDFPFLFIPYWWRQTLDRTPRDEQPAERAHGDRLIVTPHSPEAMEEVLWMAFFKHLHDPHVRNVLDLASSNPTFERFYRDHIRKLLLISGKSRYAAKGNYNLTRIEYLLKLSPGAKFVIVVRHPRDHVASLMKQHRLFSDAAQAHPRSIAHLDRVGHFEFGAHRRCINVGDANTIESIEALWREGQNVRAWARYWASLYRWTSARLASNESLRRATYILNYESLCDRPADILLQLLSHCELPDNSALIEHWSPRLTRPAYYQSKFSEDEERALIEETAETLHELGRLQNMPGKAH